MKEFSESRKKKHDYWKGIMSDWKNSELTQANYCATHHLSFATFKSWRTKLTRNHETETNKTGHSQQANQYQHPEMIPVKITQGIDLPDSFNTDVPQSKESNHHQIRIELKSGVMIYIPTGD